MSGEQVIEVPVIIVGGGGCGLSLSCFLSDYGVEHYLFEKHHGTSILPKAHYLNQRTMEIFRQHGMGDELRDKSCPARNMSKIAWMSSLGGSGPTDRKVIHVANCFGGQDGSARGNTYAHDAPVRSVNLPLYRMEPILRHHAEARNPGRVFFDHRVEDFSESDERVQVTVKDSNGQITKYRAQYLVGADGGRLVGPKLGITRQGPTGLVDMVSVHFHADLSQYWDDRYFACHLINGNAETVFASGAIVPMGPNWGKFSDEWIFHFGFALDDEHRFQEDKLFDQIRNLLKIPDLQMKPIATSHWIIERTLADSYRVGRCFIAGDAAHKRPPTTGLGLNTAIEDSNNLAWKLALTLRGNCGPSILDTYETERRPIGKKNCDWGLFTFQNSTIINAAIGLAAGQREANAARFAALFENSEVGRGLRAQVSRVCELQNIEFSAHNIELGFRYCDGVLLDDGTYPHEEDPLGQHYVPSTQPGNRLPHAWIDIDNTGNIVSTHDFVGSKCSFALITDEYGGDWVSVAKRASLQTGVDISVAQIGAFPSMGDWDDDWARYKEIRKGGALLVRPDNFVAWRSLDPAKNGGQDFVDAFKQLLKLDGRIAVDRVQSGVNGQTIGGVDKQTNGELYGHTNGFGG